MKNLNLKIRNYAVVIGIVLASVGGGCGYQFSTTGEGFPKDVRTVFVAPFVDTTRDVGIDREITSALRSEFRRRGEIRLADRLEDADAIITGVVRSLATRVVSVNKNDEVLQYEVALVVDLSLRRRSPDELLWRTQGIRLVETYSGSRGAVVTTSSKFQRGTLNASDVPQFIDIQLSETLEYRARGQLVEQFARKLYQRVVEMF
ncbi:MAG: LPS assembly lipoprotein LptE [Deltaproteobacteria bacterium]|nr:LPS assembly lipoprotein LptE [Deltaproteobacteria bacterium]